LSTSAPAAAAKIQTYIYDILLHGPGNGQGEHRQITMKVERTDEAVVVSYHNEFNDDEVSRFLPGTARLLSVHYAYPGQTEGTQADYNYPQKAIQVTGRNKGHYPLLKNTYDNTGSLFYLFSIVQPKPSDPFIFYMVQTNVEHIEDPLLRFLIAQLVGPVEMYFQYKDNEVVEVMGNSRPANHYIMGIHDGRMTPFWPNVYEFWYSETDRKLVKYQGMNAYHHVDTMCLIDYYEQ
jgi:hypothetical protein